MVTDQARAAFHRFADHCPHRLQPAVVRRPANALNIEIGSPMDRCILKEPDHWVVTGYGPRWIFSGGSPLVFGCCTMACALGHRWCTCGHLASAHRHILLQHRSASDCMTASCGCDAYTPTLTPDTQEDS